MEKHSTSQFQGVHMNDVENVDDLYLLSILLYDIDVEE